MMAAQMAQIGLRRVKSKAPAGDGVMGSVPRVVPRMIRCDWADPEAVQSASIPRQIPAKRAARDVSKWLTVIGLVLTLLGAFCGTYGVWVSPDDAIERGVSRFVGGTQEEMLQLPAVQNLLEQSRFAVAGFVLIGVGTLMQIAGVCLKGGRG